MAVGSLTGPFRKSEIAWQGQLRNFLIEDLWPSPDGGEDGARRKRRASKLPAAEGRDLNAQFTKAQEPLTAAGAQGDASSDASRDASRPTQYSWRQRNSCGS